MDTRPTGHPPGSTRRRSRGLLIATLLAGIASGCRSTPPETSRKPVGPWDVGALTQAPSIAWGASTGLVQQVYYSSEPLAGSPTRVFAWLGRPAGPRPTEAKRPALLLVHGGGGKAFADWATHWARRGYVALAMDLAGNGPAGRLPDGGPDQRDETKFRNFDRPEIREMWTYHAVAAVLRGHGLLASLPDVDPSRIGITGISWGGYLTCIVAGIDPKLHVAVPVYGCGFLHENSVWTDKALTGMTPVARSLWIEQFDPSRYLAGARMPVLFLNGTTDFAYPLDSYQKSYRLVADNLRTTAVVVDLPHGHIWSFPEVDAFVDSALLGSPALVRIRHTRVDGALATATVDGSRRLTNAAIHYTTDSGPWQKRTWKSSPAIQAPNSRKIQATIPANRPITFFIGVTDDRGLRTSGEHIALPAQP